ncbi:hypothetical protein Ahy_A03g015850 [Arachis hypogaea]|uniref:Uncharacterized protein n=1 Tax=Arachis hypogaea TaxID=3818 RepID=A0A445E1G0_ARAHY|nr:hypothetical protein Ahy_A03g015850 [Arachis hypogaea]
MILQIHHCKLQFALLHHIYLLYFERCSSCQRRYIQRRRKLAPSAKCRPRLRKRWTVVKAQFRNSILDSQKFQSNDALNNVQDLDIMMLHNTLLYLTFFLRGLHARARAQEEEIFSLWEQVAVTCMKMLNEKCNLERQFSELRNELKGTKSVSLREHS